MYRFKLTNITLNDSRQLEPTQLEPTEINVFVGPNNAGKSRVLKDILSLIIDPAKPRVLAHYIGHTLPANLQELRDSYDVERQLDGDYWGRRTLHPSLVEEAHHGLLGPSWPKAYEFGEEIQPATFRQMYGMDMVTYLSTEHRLQLVKETRSADHAYQRANLLQALYASPKEVEQQVRHIVKDAFGREIALDFTVPQKLLLRVGDSFDSLPPDPRDARGVLTMANKLDEQGDGIRSFVGIVVALMCIKRDLILVDEPEAFLHPPQAFAIGAYLSQQANQNRQLVIATHSTDILRGILSSKKRRVTVIRVDRTGDNATFNKLNPAELTRLISDPLLSSSRVLDGLFYPGAVVVEGDSDARFFQATSKKLAENVDLHFVNADNKQTIPSILKIYRDLGVRCAGIVDFDALNKGDEFEKQLAGIGLKDAELSQARTLRAEIASSLVVDSPAKRQLRMKEGILRILDQLSSSDARTQIEEEKRLSGLENRLRELSEDGKPWRDAKRRGVEALPDDAQSKFYALAEVCAKHGLFIIPTGEIESMLTGYGVDYTTDKKGWILRALTLLPDLQPDKARYPWRLQNEVLQFLGIAT